MRTKALAAPYIVWMVIFTVVPLAMVAYFAFTTNSGEFTFSNLTRAAEYMPVLLRSVWYALAACAICLVIGYPVAYVIAQTTARTQRVLYLLVTLPMCMSFLLRTLAWVALLRDTGIINTFLGIFGISPLPVSYTHLDVYKRQHLEAHVGQDVLNAAVFLAGAVGYVLEFQHIYIISVCIRNCLHRACG